MARPRAHVMTHHRLLLLKWLMIAIPPITVTVGQTVVMTGHSLRHDTVTGAPELAGIIIVTFLVMRLALEISFVFV